MNKVITSVGPKKHVDYDALTAFEAGAMSIVAVLAVVLGTIVGSAA